MPAVLPKRGRSELKNAEKNEKLFHIERREALHLTVKLKNLKWALLNRENMAMCSAALQMMEACFEKCSLGMGGAPKPLSALALCMGDNFHKIKRQEAACPISREFINRCQQCSERSDCFWEKTETPAVLAEELKGYFGDQVVNFSHQLETWLKGGDEKEVRLEFPITWLMAHYKWSVPTALPLSAPDRDVNIIVGKKGHQSLAIAPLVGDGLEEMGEGAIHSFHEHVKEGEEYESLRTLFRESSLANLTVMLRKELDVPPVRGGSYSWLVSAYAFPYILRSDDIEAFLSSVNGVSREEFLQIAHPLEVDVLMK